MRQTWKYQQENGELRFTKTNTIYVCWKHMHLSVILIYSVSWELYYFLWIRLSYWRYCLWGRQHPCSLLNRAAISAMSSSEYLSNTNRGSLASCLIFVSDFTDDWSWVFDYDVIGYPGGAQIVCRVSTALSRRIRNADRQFCGTFLLFVNFLLVLAKFLSYLIVSRCW